MPTESKIRRRSSVSPKLDLPPPFRVVTLREVGDAFAHAVAIAAEDGAGTLVHVGRFDLAEFAVVLEPDEPLRTARRAIYTGMCALGDALAAIAPPEKSISFGWPDAVRVDGGLVGGARLAWPPGSREDEPPAWLVFGVMIRLVAIGEGEPGLRPLASALDDEGFDNLDGGVLAERFARHLMAAFDASQERGFGEVAKNYLSRLAPEKAELGKVGAERPPNVVRRDIDQEGNLLIRYAGTGKVERRSLTGALAVPSWLDPESGAPRR
jgi:biotin/lipoate A/B protein ligase family protein